MIWAGKRRKKSTAFVYRCSAGWCVASTNKSIQFTADIRWIKWFSHCFFFQLIQEIFIHSGHQWSSQIFHCCWRQTSSGLDETENHLEYVRLNVLNFKTISQIFYGWMGKHRRKHRTFLQLKCSCGPQILKSYVRLKQHHSKLILVILHFDQWDTGTATTGGNRSNSITWFLGITCSLRAHRSLLSTC